MRFANHPDTNIFLGVAETICSDFLSRKSSLFDLSKKRSPRRFPEGKVWFPGRFPGRLFHILILLLVLHDTIKQPGAASTMVSENEESETRSTPEAPRKGFRKQILKKVTI